MIEIFWHIRDINFSRPQIIWIISFMGKCDWPPDPHLSGYTESENTGGSNHSYCAGFEKAVDIRAEVQTRLNATGKAGRNLVWEVQTGGVEDYRFLSPVSKQALNYCSGWRRRRISYPKWCYEQDKRRIISSGRE